MMRHMEHRGLERAGVRTRHHRSSDKEHTGSAESTGLDATDEHHPKLFSSSWQPPSSEAVFMIMAAPSEAVSITMATPSSEAVSMAHLLHGPVEVLQLDPDGVELRVRHSLGGHAEHEHLPSPT